MCKRKGVERNAGQRMAVKAVRMTRDHQSAGVLHDVILVWIG